MAKNEVATTEKDLPDYLVDLMNKGPVDENDGFDSSDIVIPQIKLLQGTSDQVTEFDAAAPGIFWHTGMDMPLGESINFIVCSRRKKYLLQAPMDDGQGILARADDAKTWDRLGKWEVKVDKKTTVTWEINDLDVERSGLTDWGTYDPTDPENSPPAATLFYEYLVLLPDHMDLGPAVISLARSQIKKAKKGLNDKISLHKANGRPLQSIKFSAKTVVEQNESNQDYFNWSFTGAGFATKEQFEHARELAGLLENYAVQNEGETDEAPKADSDQF